MVSGGAGLLYLTRLGMQDDALQVRKGIIQQFLYSVWTRGHGGANQKDCFCLSLQDPGQEEKSSVIWCARV